MSEELTIEGIEAQWRGQFPSAHIAKLHIDFLLAKLDEMREALQMIADISEGSTTANSLPHIAKLARAALAQHHGTEGEKQ